jgi:hypothetical protein
MIVGRALLAIAKNLVGADDRAKSQRRVRIARPNVGMGALDGPAKRDPQALGVVLWKRPKQIVKRIHCVLATGTRSPAEIPVAKFSAEHASTNSPLPKIMLIQWGEKMTLFNNVKNALQ